MVCVIKQASSNTLESRKFLTTHCIIKNWDHGGGVVGIIFLLNRIKK